MGIAACVVASFLSAAAAHASGGWVQLNSSGSSLNSADISSDFGLAVGGSSTIFRTEDGGKTWGSNIGAASALTTMYGVDVISTTTALISGQGGIERTTDGGDTWTMVLSDSSKFSDVSMGSSTIGVAITSGGDIYRTTDGGSAWTLVTASGHTLQDVLCYTGGNPCWAVGKNSSGDAVVLKSSTGGSTWSTTTLTTADELQSVDFVSTTTGWAVGNNATFLKTTNGGSTWSTVTSESLLGTETLTSIDMYTSAIGFVGTDDDSIIQTTDGSTWTNGTEVDAIADIYSIVAHSSSPIAVGSAGAIFRYDVTAPDAPTNFTVADNTTTDRTPSFTWTAAVDDETEIASYEVQRNSGVWTNIGNVTSYTWPTTITEGDHTFAVRALDTAGNVSSETTEDVSVDLTAPTVPVPDVTATEVGDETTYRVYAEDAETDIASCTLYVDSSYVGEMTDMGTYFSYSEAAATAGSFSAFASCIDNAGNRTTGSSTSFTVTASSSSSSSSSDTTVSSSESSEAVSEAEPGNLIKLACDAGADVNDPCKAVYYSGEDGKRHAFPNEKTYFTWYADFDDVIIVTDDYMASLTLGYNVTYHPGSRMVKFITVNTVYAVGNEGELRAIDSEDTAISIWGSTWNTQVDDISDAFFGNYTFGEDIDSTSDFDPDEVEDSVDSIDDIL